MGLMWHVKVKPGAFKDEISVDKQGNWIIKIREKPIDGAANNYLVKFLAKEFNLSKSEIIIEKGLSSPFKKIRLNLSEAAFEQMLQKHKQ